MKIAFLGATSGMGRALARQLAAEGHQLFLLGRNAEELERSAADLTVRSNGAAVGAAYCDLERVESFEAALIAADAALANFDAFIITAALFATQDQLEADIQLVQRLVTINYAHTVVLCELVRKRLLSRGGGTLVVFSSVAGDRGRKPVAIYGSSKAGLSHYLESLDHKFRAEGLVTICVKPGFVKTGATVHLKPPPFAGEPEQVAVEVSRAIAKGTPMIYTPRIWALVMAVIRLLPRLVMRKIGF